jgi:hypothetical protein
MSYRHNKSIINLEQGFPGRIAKEDCRRRVIAVKHLDTEIINNSSSHIRRLLVVVGVKICKSLLFLLFMFYINSN